MDIWKGAPVAAAIKQQVAMDVEMLKKQNVLPTLGIIRIGENEDDLSYERGIRRRFEEMGAGVQVKTFPNDVCQQEIEDAISAFNQNENIHGILVFSSIPKGIQIEALRAAICSQKDVDGFGWENMGYILAQDYKAFHPCTAEAVVEMLKFYKEDLVGKKITIVGRSLVVGRPLAMMLMKENATVTVCHTKTKDVPAECKDADIVVACAGVKKLIDGSYVKPGQVVLDVGIHEDGNSLCGDVSAEDMPDLKALTPVPGGVGAVTTALLLKHVVESAKRTVGA